jgi:hypothetical protein
MSYKNTEARCPGSIWAISNGSYLNLDLDNVDHEIKEGIKKEYRISDLATYMLNPNPIEVEKTLAGCEVHYKQPSSSKIRERIRRILPQKLHRLIKDKRIPSDELVSGFERRKHTLKDKDLEDHLNNIYDLLRPHDPIQKGISGLDIAKISNVVGICRDIDGNRSMLNFQGNIDEKIDYIKNFVSTDVRVVLKKSYVSDGLFEMGAFDFKSYSPNNSLRLIKFFKNGKVKYCVLNSHNKVKYWVDDIRLVRYIHLLEQTIRTNSKFSDSLKLCAEGKARPLKLFFYKQLKIDYSKVHLPEAYREAFKICNMGMNEKELVINTLKNFQIGIAFNYVYQSDSGEDKCFVDLSVMHDFRALEPIKDNLPKLYSEINKKTYTSEAGKFYLLDSIRGCRK